MGLLLASVVDFLRARKTAQPLPGFMSPNQARPNQARPSIRSEQAGLSHLMAAPGSMGTPASSTSSSPRSSAETALPFPTPLPRSDFLAPAFSPSTYLSDLTPSRHQILEDLRSDLRMRSQQLSSELLDLVNAHYTDFLNVGGSLRGGREKVEEVRVGLMGFQREVEGIRESLLEKEVEVRALVEERRRIRLGMERGRTLLDWGSKVQALERHLGVGKPGEFEIRQKMEEGTDDEDSGSDEEEQLSDDETEEDAALSLSKISSLSLARLKKRTQEFRLIQLSATRIGSTHPFVVAQQSRLLRIRNTLLLDLSSCLRQTTKSPAQKIDVIALYGDIGAESEAVESIRSLGSKR